MNRVMFIFVLIAVHNIVYNLTCYADDKFCIVYYTEPLDLA